MLDRMLLNETLWAVFGGDFLWAVFGEEFCMAVLGEEFVWRFLVGGFWRELLGGELPGDELLG